MGYFSLFTEGATCNHDQKVGRPTVRSEALKSRVLLQVEVRKTR